MSEFSQIERILRIIQILSSGSRLTTSALVKRFDNQIAIRTIQRDLNKISAAGIPLQSRKTVANENEWYLDAGFRSFIPQTLGLNEYLAAHMLKENLKVFRNTEFSTEIDSLLDKIDQIVPEQVFMETDDISAEEVYENYTTGLFDYSGYDDIINTTIKAILQKQKCWVSYRSAYEQKTKNFFIEPRRVVYFRGGLYVIVYIRKFDSFRLLAIQRVKKIKHLDETRPDEPEFHPAIFKGGKFGLFSAEAQEVTLEFSKDVRMHIENRFWHVSQSTEEGKDDSLILHLHVGLSPELVSWILSWSGYVKVLKPQELIDKIMRRLKTMAKTHQTSKKSK